MFLNNLLSPLQYELPFATTSLPFAPLLKTISGRLFKAPVEYFEENEEDENHQYLTLFVDHSEGEGVLRTPCSTEDEI